MTKIISLPEEFFVGIPLDRQGECVYNRFELIFKKLESEFTPHPNNPVGRDPR